MGGGSASEGDAKRKRLSTGSTVKSTAKKSKYFDGSETDESPSDDEDDSGSSYGQDEATEDDQSAGEEAISDEESEENVPKRRGRGRPASSAKTQNTDPVEDEKSSPTQTDNKSKELWREGVRTGLGPGKEVFIRKPKPRDLGGIDYKDDTIHPNTILFLKDLKKNNERQWLKGKRFGNNVSVLQVY